MNIKHFFEPKPLHILDMQNPLTVVEETHPIGSIYYTTFPVEGLFSVSGYRDDSAGTRYRIAVFGKLLLPLSFGYPDDSYRGDLIAGVINKRDTFRRGENGHFELRPATA